MSVIGENIDAYCLKCKLMLAHVIMFKVEGDISKVKCNTCGAQHKYRAKMPAPKKSAVSRPPTLKETIAKRAAAAKVDANNAPMQWDIRNRSMDHAASVKDYSIHNQYRAKDVVNHHVFGLGFVERIVSDKSMDVLFSDAVKLMAMNIST
ncbi:MAG: hypothetical protein WCO53_03850 [Deltaproteobacteria bacterium]